MKRKYLFILIAAVTFSVIASDAYGQRKKKLGRVCGDPTAACAGGENFQPSDLPFETGKNFVIAESEWFYGIVLQSVKLKDYGDCEKPSFAESVRAQLQSLFSKNKVFTLNCVESGTNYYNGVADKTAFIGLYAGKTLVDANKFLKSVQATNKFPGIKVRRMQIGINGT